MLLAVLVVAQRAPLNRARQEFPVDAGRTLGVSRRPAEAVTGEGGGELEQVERDAGVAGRVPGHCLDGAVGHLEMGRAEATLGVVEGAAQDGDRLVRRERLQHEDARPR